MNHIGLYQHQSLRMLCSYTTLHNDVTWYHLEKYPAHVWDHEEAHKCLWMVLNPCLTWWKEISSSFVERATSQTTWMLSIKDISKGNEKVLIRCLLWYYDCLLSYPCTLAPMCQVLVFCLFFFPMLNEGIGDKYNL